jgi:hypothetical protein
MKRTLALALCLASLGCGSKEDSAESTTTSIIVSNRAISGSSTDLCTQFDGESCYFLGGQLVAFADGSMIVTGGMTRNYFVTGDTDVESVSNSIVAPPGQDVAVLMSLQVSRGSGVRAVWLKYTHADGKVSVVYDTDNDMRASVTDAVLLWPTVSDWK